MGKTKKQVAPPARVMLRGILLTIGAEIVALMVLALLLVKGIVPENVIFPVVAVMCLVATLLGGLSVARKTPWGVMATAMFQAGGVAILMLAIGFGCWQQISWSGQGGCLLLCVLAGGVLAGILGRQKGKRKRRL